MEGQDEYRNRSHGRCWVEIRENGVWTTGGVVVVMEMSLRVLYPWESTQQVSSGWVPETLTHIRDKKKHPKEKARVATVHCSISCLSQCRLRNTQGSAIITDDDSDLLFKLLLERKTNIFLKMEIERCGSGIACYYIQSETLMGTHFW